MRINAYVLAADPTWLATSVLAYYDHVERIVVSYDASSRGWSGAPVQVDACLAILRSIDSDAKIEWLEGNFAPRSTAGRSLVEADTWQRKSALARASTGADWVLQIDTDEVLPKWEPVAQLLGLADREGVDALEWPMRILFRQLRDGRFLEVVGENNEDHFEYPGPIAVRPGAELIDCRRGTGSFLRPVVSGDTSSVQIAGPAEEREHRVPLPDRESAIWHNSWGRTRSSTRQKVASWSHNQGMRSWVYYYARWLPAPVLWRTMRRFHPLYPPLWPRLAVAPDPPFDLVSPDVRG